MSYRGVKRLLGETSLERKCRFLFGACLLALITGSFWWYSGETEKLVRKASQHTGRGLVDAALLKYHLVKFAPGEGEPVENFQPTSQKLSEALESQEYRYNFIHPRSSG